jgi:hypothetical protein
MSQSWIPEESQVESSEHQDNANIHYQPFPESVSKEQQIYADYNDCHHHHIKHDKYLFAHLNNLRAAARVAARWHITPTQIVTYICRDRSAVAGLHR